MPTGIARKRFEQLAHALADAKDLSGRSQLIEYLDHRGFQTRQPLAYHINAYAFALKRLAVDRKIGLAAEIDFRDAPASAKDFQKHVAYSPAILWPPHGAYQSAIDVKQDYAEIRVQGSGVRGQGGLGRIVLFQARHVYSLDRPPAIGP